MLKKLAIALMLVPTLSTAIVIGDSNLGVFGYPDPTCSKPMRPTKPYSFTNRYEVDSYNSQVELFNGQMENYVWCIKRYLEAASNDMDKIKEKMDEAVKRAKSQY